MKLDSIELKKLTFYIFTLILIYRHSSLYVTLNEYVPKNKHEAKMKPLLLSLLLLPAVAFANPTKIADDYCDTFKDISIKAYDTKEPAEKIAKDAIASLNVKKFDFAKIETTEAQFTEGTIEVVNSLRDAKAEMGTRAEFQEGLTQIIAACKIQMISALEKQKK